MIFKKIIKKIFTKFNISTYGTVKKKDILKLIDLLRPFDLGVDHIRLGGNSDGSYIVPKILEDMKYCFSAGYGGDCSFEKNLEEIGIKTFLADYSYDAPEDLKSCIYTKKFISSFNDDKSIDINKWIIDLLPEKNSNLILQLDIEGSEYEVIHAISENNLKKFDIVIIELHNLFMVDNQIFFKFFYNFLKKLKKHYEVFYLQPNNCCGVSNFDDIIFPNILEITLLNKSKAKKKEKFKLNNLEIKNISSKDLIKLPSYWY